MPKPQSNAPFVIVEFDRTELSIPSLEGLGQLWAQGKIGEATYIWNTAEQRWTNLKNLGVRRIRRDLAQESRRSAMMADLAKISGFMATHQFIGADGGSGIAVDDTSKKVCFAIPGLAPRQVGYRDLLGAEVLQQDGVTVTKTSGTGGRAIVGALLLGPVGALAGLGGPKTSVSFQSIARVDLRVLIKDSANPSYVINFFLVGTKVAEAGVAWDTNYIYFLDRQDAWSVEEAVKGARSWQAGLLTLKEQADREDLGRVSAVAPTWSVADELEKLADLRNRGILTDEEFAREKLNVLQRGR